MCKVQTKVYELLSCEEKEFLLKIDSMSSEDLEVLVKNIKLKTGNSISDTEEEIE